MAEYTQEQREQALDALRELEYWAKGNRVILQDKHYKALGVAIAVLGQPKMIEKPISTENALISGDGPGEITDIVQDSKRQSDDSVQRKSAESASVPCPAQNSPEKDCSVPNQVRLQYPYIANKGVCVVCGGFFWARRTYEGFDEAVIVEWICDTCGRIVKISTPRDGQLVHDNVPNCSSNSTDTTLTGDNPHIGKPSNSTFGIDAFDCFMEQAFGMVRAKSGSETPPKQGAEIEDDHEYIDHLSEYKGPNS